VASYILLAPIAALPRDVVTGLWLLLCYLCAIWTCRRLTIPWLAIAFLLAWPPFAEGLLTGNVQILGFAAFVALLYERADGGLRQRAFLPARDLVNIVPGTLGADTALLGAAELAFEPILADPAMIPVRKAASAARWEPDVLSAPASRSW